MSVYFKGFDGLEKGSDTAAIDYDSLDVLFTSQENLMRLMDSGRFPQDIYFLLTAMNLQGEITEAIEFYGDITKPWKENYEFDVDHVKEEWVDILFFWLQGAITLGITPNELIEIYSMKHRKNVERIRNRVKSETN